MQFPNNFFSTLVTIILQIAQNGALLVYSGNPGAGNLVASVAGTAGTDIYGNAYLKGFAVYAGTQQLNASISGSNIFLSLATGDSHEFSVPSLTVNLTGSAPIYERLFINGPIISDRHDQATIILHSANTGATVLTAGGVGQYIDTTGTSHTAFQWDTNGFNATGTFQSSDPNAVLPTVEAWHALSLNTGFADAGSPTAAVSFQRENVNLGRVRLRGRVNLTANQVAGTTIATIGTTFYQPGANQELMGSSNLSGLTTGRAPVFIDTSGHLSLTVAGTSGNFVQLDGMVYDLN